MLLQLNKDSYFSLSGKVAPDDSDELSKTVTERSFSPAELHIALRESVSCGNVDLVCHVGRSGVRSAEVLAVTPSGTLDKLGVTEQFTIILCFMLSGGA